MIFRGICVPFDAPSQFGDSIDPDAFDEFIAAEQCIPVLWRGHKDDAPVIATTTCLFVTPLGLGFGFALDDPVYAMEIVRGGCNGASILYTSEPDDTDVVKRASLEHIAILPPQDAAFGRNTLVWRADPEAQLANASMRIRDANDVWLNAYSSHVRQRLKARRPAPATTSAHAALSQNILNALFAAIRNGHRGPFGLSSAYLKQIKAGKL